jgi:hypothetical protein
MADPRQALIQQMMQTQKGSPDLPGRGAIQEFQQNPTDSTIMQFLNQFGEARANNPTGPRPGEIPMPRPRMPDMQPDVMGPTGMSPMAPGGLRTQDVMRNLQDPWEGGGYEAVQGVQRSGYAADPKQPTDEQMLDDVHSQMGGFDWEGGDGPPTSNDIARAKQDTDLRQEFIDKFGGTPEEFENDGDADDMGDD